MFETLLTDRKNLSTSGNIPFTLCNHSFEITQGIFPQREANSILIGGMQEPLTPTGFPIQSAGLLPTTFPASVTDSSLDPVTGEAMSGVYKALTAFATDPNFTDRMNVPFGESWDKEKAKALKEEWLRGNFSNIPLVKVVSSGDIAGANGAFGTATNTIYLSKEFLAQNATRLDALTGVLLEEVGHFIDSQVNHLDSPGDEGEIFAAVVQGKNLSQEKLQLLKAEDDRAMALIEGKEISIEQVANTVTVSAIDASAAEVISGQTANGGTYRISRTESTTASLAVPYTMSGTGSNGTDYTSLNGTATIAAGQTFVDVPLNVIDDTLIENNENAILTVSPSTNYTVGATDTAIVTIADNDQNTVTVSAIDASAAEVISGQNPNGGTYRISRTGSTNSALAVPYTMSGTGSNGTDYTSLNGTATIAAGQTFVDVPLNVIDDTLIENNENAILTVSPSTNYTVGATDTAIVTIADNDQNTVTVSAIDASAAEVISGQNPNGGTYRISRTGSTNSALAVPYTMSGTGSNGTDYTSLNGTATIAAGQTFVDVPLNVIDDTLIENNENAILTVSPSTNYTVGATDTAIVTIADNDQNTVTVSAIDASAAEVISGQNPNGGTYRISRTGSTTASLAVPYTMSGTGSNGTDYTSLNGTATIAAGQTFVDVPLNVIDDTLIENNENAILTVSPSTNYTVGATDTAIVTIADNDQNTVTVSAIDASAAEVISGQSANGGTYRISRTGSTNSALAVPYTMSGTGSNGTDYTSLNGTATIAAGQTFVDVPLNVIDDTLIENNENAILTVSPSTNYTVGATDTAIVTIADNDQNTVTVSAIDASAAEVISGQSANGGTYRISRTGSTNSALAVPYTMSGTGSNGTDYTSLNGTATIAAGQTFVDVPLNVIDDTLIENNENAILTVSPSTNYTVGATNTAAVTIADNDPIAPPDYAGNTPSAARQVTVGSTSTTWSDWVGTEDTNDYYKFTLANNSNFNLSLNGLSSDADVHLLDSTGTTIIQSSTSGGSSAESISTMLNAGAYYVQVFPYSGSTNYNLSMSAVPNLSTVTVSAIDASAAEVISGQTPNPGTYRISRTGNPSSALTVPYTMSGTSLNGTDYTSLNGTATIAAGQTFVDVPLNVIDDTLIESNETAILTVSSSSNYTVGATNTATVTIADNDQNTVTVSAIDASAAEVISGQIPNPGMYRISRTGSTSSALAVPYTMSGTSLNGTDYTSLNGTATIAAGQTFVDVTLNVIDDTLIESNETAILTVSSSSNYTVGATNTATVTIADNDQNTVTVSAIDASAAEVISGQNQNPGTYRISRTGSTSSALAVPYTMSGTSLNGTDYTSLNGTATIAAGQTFVDVTLNVIDDTLIESNETAILTVSSSSNYTVGATNTATVTIADNDPIAPPDYAGNTPSAARQVTVGSTSTTWSDWVGTEDTNDYYKFTLANNSNFNLSLNGLSSDADVHLLDSTGTTIIQSSTSGGSSAESISTMLNAGAYYVQVFPYSGSTNYNLSMSAVPNLSTVTVSAIDASAAEVISGQTPNPGTYRISRTGNPSSALTVPYTMSGTSLNGTDYTSLNGTATIAAGQTFVDVPLNVIDDTLIESNETAILTVSSSSNYTVGATNTATVTIADNDQNTVTVSAIDASAAEVISGQIPNPGMYRISRTGSTSSALAVPYTMSGTSLNGTDYTSLNGTATIAAGQTFVDVTLNVIDDTLIESNETAILTVSSSSNYTVGATNTATVTIADNDQNTVTVSAIDASAAEVISGQNQNPGTYRISRTGSTSSALAVPYTMSGTSLNGTDYTSLNGTATIAAGQTFVDVTLNVIDDTLIESNETAILTVSSSSNYTVGATNTATVTIADNDQNTVTVSAIDASAAEVISGQNQNPGTYRISRTGSTSSALAVPYTMSGTSLNGTDYTSLNGTATIAAGQTFVDVTLNVIDDTLIESNETAILTVSSSSNYTVGATNTATVTIADNDLADWFDLNIQDLGLRSTARVAASDSVINRNEMISILQNAEDGSVIDSTELTNLRNLLTSNTRPFTIPQFVQNLTNKVVNSEIANQTYLGNPLGNLSANSSATQMENLINKWFLGLDRPITPYTYQYASGSLFQNGASYQDIAQGEVGDCYFLASLAVTAFRSPSTIQNMFTDNGDNTYTVRFYKNDGVADYVTVDRYLPTYAGGLPYAKTPNSELWVALAEKAYAQVNQSGWIEQDGTNSYFGIDLGASYYAIPHVTGRNTWQIYNPSGIVDTNAIKNAFNAGQMITVGSKDSGAASNVVANHEYVLVGYNSSTQQFRLYNPHGVSSTPNSGHLDLTAFQLSQSFDSWTYTTENGMPQYGSSGTLQPKLFR